MQLINISRYPHKYIDHHPLQVYVTEKKRNGYKPIFKILNSPYFINERDQPIRHGKTPLCYSDWFQSTWNSIEQAGLLPHNARLFNQGIEHAMHSQSTNTQGKEIINV